MRTLLLVRHAKSSWKDPHLVDHQRPLNQRGKKAAPQMGKRLQKRGVRPDVVVSSDARRAVDTAALMADMLGLSAQAIRQDPALYHAAPDEILEIISHFKDKWRIVMVVGHNPGFTELANRFYPHPIANMPTAGVVELGFNTRSWRRISPDKLEYSSFDFPKNK